MTLNRSIFCVVIATYVWAIEGCQSIFAPAFLTSGLILAFGIMVHLIRHPEAHNGRRIFAVAVDMGSICLVMHEGDESTAVFFPLILWIICGNGFRFGLPGLWASTALGLFGFSAVVATTVFWKESWSLTIGLLVGMIILPAYVSILIKKLYLAKARAEEASHAKSAFLTNVSHELRTPLQAIIGAGNLLTRTQANDEQTGLFQTVKEASNILLSMVDQLLKFSSIEQGTLTRDVREFNVLDLLSEVKRVVSAASQSKGLTISMHVDVSTPFIVKADRTLIRDVLISLAGNAIKFTDKGGVLFTVDAREQTPYGARLRFEVIDTGVGVAPEIQQEVFDRFFTSANASNPGLGGTGIGLAICKSLVEVLGGDIGLHESHRQGAAFWFRVPIELGTVAPRQSTSPKPRAALFIPYNVPKGRLIKEVSEQGRSIMDAGSPNRTFREFLTTAWSEPCIMLVATPKSDAAYTEMFKTLKEADSRSHTPIVLVDEVGQDVPAQDLRWLAPLRLHWNFSDEDMRHALEAADLLATCIEASEDIVQPDVLRQLRILIVDDNKTSRVIFSKMVEGLGHVCDLAANGDEALNALEIESFSLVLMDVNMPEMDGLEATKLQRVAELGLSRTPIFGITADATPELAERCRRAGMDGCLVKPITITSLQRLLATFNVFPIQDSDSVSNVADLHEQPVELEIDRALILSLRDIGGQDFVREVFADFIREVVSLVDNLSLALARADIANSRFLGHALASAAANIGAVRIRKLGLEIESASDLKLRADGHNMVKEMRYRIAGFANAMQQSAY